MGTQQSKDTLSGLRGLVRPGADDQLPTIVVPEVAPIDGVAGLVERFEVAQGIYEDEVGTEQSAWAALRETRGDRLAQMDWLCAQRNVREAHELRLAIGRQLQAAVEEAGE